MVMLILAAGCTGTWSGGPKPIEATADENPFRVPRDLAPERSGTNGVDPLAPRIAELSVLHVSVPEAGERSLERVWSHVREDVLDSETQLRLRRNGFRVGAGHAQDWEAVKAVIDATDNCRVNDAPPVRLPEGFPLDLELIGEPRDQTIFCMERDGILSGATLASSRNVLRVVHTPDSADARRMRFAVVPCALQDRAGMRWIKTESGVAQVPRYAGRAYTSAGFSLSVTEGEFVVISPGPEASLPGIVGRVFLREESEDGVAAVYLFIRAAILNESLN